MDCSEFYRRRDGRTTEYLRGETLPRSSVHVVIDRAAAESASGQLALLGLANQLARAHRRITFALPDPRVPALVRTPFAGDTLGEVLLGTVSAIDPCGTFALGAAEKGSSTAVGIGQGAPGGLDWYIGADRAVAQLSRVPVGFTSCPATMRGAALASCLAAAAVFRQVLGTSSSPRCLSAWNYEEGAAAWCGPGDLLPVDVGHVLMVGAGAVGSALAFWLHAFGAGGTWTLVDGDIVELHNTNRCLPFAAHHAGWPDGEACHKVEVIAPLLPNTAVYPVWYDRCGAIQNEKFDVILGLANDRSVRHLLAGRNVVVTMQATTGATWLSEMHRHILGRDDCLWCRTGEIETPQFACSTASLALPDGTRSDAALPFLSAASGLMLAVALQRLQHGDLMEEARNDWRWDFGSMHRMVSSGVRRCREGCQHIHSPSLRSRINAGRRWAHLDLG